MIEIKQVKKSYDKITAVDTLSMAMVEKEVFGLVGTNGAGKSTLLRMMAGVLKADEGEILIDGLPVYDNPEAKKNIFFVPDDAYFFPHATPGNMADYYAGIYKAFDRERFSHLLDGLSLPEDRDIATFSKGMKKQLSIILGICAGTKYLFCDETFDGLDPVMRQAAKSLLAKDMEDRGLTPILTSHNLRELEDICDHVGLLHQGGVLLSRDINDMKLNICKLQCVYATEEAQAEAENSMREILLHDVRGRLHTYTVRMSEKELGLRFKHIDTVFYEVLPLTLEEIFISETEVVGYDFAKLLED